MIASCGGELQNALNNSSTIYIYSFLKKYK